MINTIFRDGFDVGNFGFYKDSDLTLKLSDDNLFDQVDANGWVDVWFGGADVWIPDFGTYNVFISSEQSMFWDILDENGNRTKDGFSEMYIINNPSLEVHSGDIIPNNPEEVFNHHSKSPALETTPLICSNLWFYTNFFDDNYYRYNLLILKQGQSWPDEVNVDVRPMSDKLILEQGEYIVGYRPKPEYMNQLAVVRNMSSGTKNAIQFKLKVDLSFLSQNPDTKRTLKIFSQKSDSLEYLLFPKSTADILWDNHDNIFFSLFQRHLLKYGISQYVPNENELEKARLIYLEYIDISNLVLQMDTSNIRLAIDAIDKVWAGEDFRLTGYAALLFPYFTKWVSANIQISLPSSVMDIVEFVILTGMPFTGFDILDERMGLRIGVSDDEIVPGVYDGNVEILDGTSAIVFGGVNRVVYFTEINDIKIINNFGVREFSDGYIPSTASGYLHPPAGHLYEGSIGNGIYKLRGLDGSIMNVYCDMVGGGWMYIVVSINTDLQYLSQFGDVKSITETFYQDQEKGIGWGNSGVDPVYFIDKLEYTEIQALVSSDLRKEDGSEGMLDIRTNGDAFITISDIGTNMDDTQLILLNGEINTRGMDSSFIDLPIRNTVISRFYEATWERHTTTIYERFTVDFPFEATRDIEIRHYGYMGRRYDTFSGIYLKSGELVSLHKGNYGAFDETYSLESLTGGFDVTWATHTYAGPYDATILVSGFKDFEVDLATMPVLNNISVRIGNNKSSNYARKYVKMLKIK